MVTSIPMTQDRKPRLVADLTAMMSDLSGEALGPDEAGVPFLELGFDSLFLGQVAQAVGRDFGVTVSFRSLMADHPTIAALAAHLDAEMPAEVVEAAPAPAPANVVAPVAQPAPVVAAPVLQAARAMPAAGLEGVIARQMDAMQAMFRDQLAALGGGGAAPVPAAAPVAAVPAPVPAPWPRQRWCGPPPTPQRTRRRAGSAWGVRPCWAMRRSATHSWPLPAILPGAMASALRKARRTPRDTVPRTPIRARWPAIGRSGRSLSFQSSPPAQRAPGSRMPRATGSSTW